MGMYFSERVSVLIIHPLFKINESFYYSTRNNSEILVTSRIGLNLPKHPLLFSDHLAGLVVSGEVECTFLCNAAD